MNNYEYKVGDVGVTRDGSPYEIIAVVDKPFPCGETYVARMGMQARTYHPNGRLVSGIIHGLDLLPPTRSVWVNIYPNGYASHFASASKARHSAADGAISVAVPVELPR